MSCVVWKESTSIQNPLLGLALCFLKCICIFLFKKHHRAVCILIDIEIDSEQAGCFFHGCIYTDGSSPDSSAQGIFFGCEEVEVEDLS